MKSFAHVIFDCDGVLVDSEAISMNAEAQMMRGLGVAITAHELHDRFVGRTSQEIWVEIAAEHALKLPADFKTWYEDQMEAIYRDQLLPVPGVPDMLTRLAIPVSCASNSTRRMLGLKLGLTQIAHVFGPRTHSADDVAKPKPAPDLYLRAAETAGFEPADCLVIEDTPTGTRAGVAAGMTVFGFTGAYAGEGDPASALTSAGARLIFADMRALPDLLVEYRR